MDTYKAPYAAVVVRSRILKHKQELLMHFGTTRIVESKIVSPANVGLRAAATTRNSEPAIWSVAYTASTENRAT